MAPAPLAAAKVRTRFLILADTHGAKPREPPEKHSSSYSEAAFRKPLKAADVVLHCGDLTQNSEVDEFRDAFRFLREIDAPLKLVIGGNHDSLLDPNHIKQQGSEWKSSTPMAREIALAKAEEVRAIIEDAKKDGVQYLEEGNYTFVLQNGASLRLYASPTTPSHSSYAFQFEGAHDFIIQKPVDVVMTHGPARGVLDLTKRGLHGGCGDLFRALYAARPKLHCHGHIHESWGAQLMTWKDAKKSVLSRETAMDTSRTKVFEELAATDSDRFCSEEESLARLARRKRLVKSGAASVSVCEGVETALREGEQTLFVNAAIMDKRNQLANLPWLVDLELSKAED